MTTPRQPVYELGDIVRLIIDTDKEPGMVTGIYRRFSGVTYCVTWCAGHETLHFAQELKSTELPPDV